MDGCIFSLEGKMIDPVSPAHGPNISSHANVPNAAAPNVKRVQPASGASDANLNANGDAGRQLSPDLSPRAPVAPGTIAGPPPAFEMNLMEAAAMPKPSIPLPQPEAKAEAAPPAEQAAEPAPKIPEDEATMPKYQSFESAPARPSVDETR